MQSKTYDEVFHNTKIKKYPQGFCKVTVASRKIFKEKGWELSNTFEPLSKPQSSTPITRNDSRHRTVTNIYDIICMNANTFKYFVTLTLNKEKVTNRNDPKEVISLLRSFLKNMTARHGLKYILIPEYHKNGGIHLHGLFSDDIKLVDSGTRKAKGYEKPLAIDTLIRKGISPDNCQIVYNLPQWKYGFSTAYEVYGDINGIASYVTKYITKDLAKIFGNFYYAGGDIIREVPYDLLDVDYQTAECDKECIIPNAFLSLKYLTTD